MMAVPDLSGGVLWCVLPFAALVAGGIVTALLGAWRSRWGVVFAWLSLIGAAVGLFPLARAGSPLSFWEGAVLSDRFSILFIALLLVSGVFALLLSEPVLRREEKVRAEFYSLLLFALSGMVLLVSTTNMLLLFIALELTSIPLYVLCGYRRNDERGGESALKYFLLGSFSSAILLFGMALLFGATGTIDLAAMSGGGGLLSVAGILLILTGFLFKVGAVPFHMWAPDVYDGAPVQVTSFMATSVKIAAFGLLLRLFALAGGSHPVADFLGREVVGGILFWLAVLTMTIGNLCALTQNNIKRMLAWSSIAHAGYLLIGLVPGSGAVDTTGMIYYLAGYLLMTSGAFAVVAALSSREKGREVVSLERFAGVGFRAPLLGAAMTLFMISLGGIPPTAGFFGKYLIFRGAIDRGLTTLVIIAVLNSAVSLYYYLRVVVFFYMRKTDRPAAIDRSISIRVAAVTALFLVLWVGFGPDIGGIPGIPTFLEWIRAAAASLL